MAPRIDMNSVPQTAELPGHTVPAVKTRARNVGQKFALASSALCATLIAPSIGLFFWLKATRGFADTWTASAVSIALFFLSCAVVLYVLSRPGKVLLPTDLHRP